MTRVYRSSTCERSRAWAALTVDGELSLLEHRLLESHLARCPVCAAFAADVGGVTAALRSQPLEVPSSAVMTPLRQKRRRKARRLPAAGKAAAFAAVAVGAFSVGSLTSSEVTDSSRLRPVIVDGATAAAAQAEPDELRTYRHALLLEEAGVTPVATKQTGLQPL